MAVKAIAYSYWRSIKRGNRTFGSIPDSVKDDVRTLAKLDVQEGITTVEQYEQYIGDPYVDGETV